MGRSQESFNKKEVRNRKEKTRKEKEKKRLARKDNEKGSSLDDMMAYVDENGMITSTPPPITTKTDTKLEDIIISVPKQDPSLKPDSIRKGIVTYFNESKGYGFIKDSETQESVFVHVNNLLEAINEGNVVSFEVAKGQKGPTAIQVKLYK
ncbi:MAG: cold shock domain-containing protein [Bacteroidota bacterium]